MGSVIGELSATLPVEGTIDDLPVIRVVRLAHHYPLSR